MNVDRSVGPLKFVAVAALACGLIALPTLAASADLPTRTGNEVGVSLSSYKYTEPGLLSLKANKIGFDYSGTYALDAEWPNRNKGWFVRGDLHFATGKADYSSPISGSLNNRSDWYYEAKGLIGKDFHFDGYTLSPYAGLGYRYLYNDLRGITNFFAAGYRRESNYFTLPVGVTHKMALANQSQLVSTAEFSYLLRGRQESKLSDVNPVNQDVTNRQRSGYGLRLGTMVQFSTWSVGPSVMVWRFKDSDRTAAGLFEPRNNTTEVGIKAAYSF